MASTRRKQSLDAAAAAAAGPEFPPPAYINIPLNSPNPGAYKTPTTTSHHHQHYGSTGHYGHLPAMPPPPAQRPTSAGYGALRLLCGLAGLGLVVLAGVAHGRLGRGRWSPPAFAAGFYCLISDGLAAWWALGRAWREDASRRMWWDGVAGVGLAVMLCLGTKLVFVVAGGTKNAPVEGTVAVGVAIVSCMAFEVFMHMAFCMHAVWEKNWLWANSFFTADGERRKEGMEFGKV